MKLFPRIFKYKCPISQYRYKCAHFHLSIFFKSKYPLTPSDSLIGYLGVFDWVMLHIVIELDDNLSNLYSYIELSFLVF